VKNRAPLWPPPAWLCFAWGLAEATFFFLIPDIILSWAALSGVKTGLKALGAVLAGSIVGGIGMYAWASHAPDSSRAAVAHVPFVRQSMFVSVEQDYAKHGMAGMLRGPTSGIPYKIHAVLAPPHGPLSSFILMSIPARLERIVVSWLGFAVLSLLLGGWMRSHRAATTMAFLAFWAAMYAFYWSRI
jgi:hypothetical protein